MITLYPWKISRLSCALSALILYGAAGCSDDAPVAAMPDAPAVADLARGKYLVESVMSCGDCHTPRTPDGKPDLSKTLSGVECFARDAKGCVHSANLTSDDTGLKAFSDAQVKNMLTKGLRGGGQASPVAHLSPVMPYWIFSALADADADDIVAYLRTVAPVVHSLPANDPGPPIPLLALSSMPGDEGNGKYLATLACAGCHSPTLPTGLEDLTRPFQGGRDFPAASVGLPVPPFPDHIFSANLTPDGTGLGGWTAANVVRVLHEGIDLDGKALCPPMPFGPMGGFGGLSDDDAGDIAAYLLALPPVKNAIPGLCFAPTR